MCITRENWYWLKYLETVSEPFNFYGFSFVCVCVFFTEGITHFMDGWMVEGGQIPCVWWIYLESEYIMRNVVLYPLDWLT